MARRFPIYNATDETQEDERPLRGGPPLSHRINDAGAGVPEQSILFGGQNTQRSALTVDSDQLTGFSVSPRLNMGPADGMDNELEGGRYASPKFGARSPVKQAHQRMFY